MFIPIVFPAKAGIHKITTEAVRTFWIVGSSPTVTEKDNRFKQKLESIISAMSFPRKRESINLATT